MKKFDALTKLIFFAFLITGTLACSSSRFIVAEEDGVASWYGPGFHGKKTANGERFNQNDYTCAHRTLPFNTKIRVINKDNGKAIVVRVNDRGPYAKDRIIDLSKAAAKKIGMLDNGTARVKLQIFGTNSQEVNTKLKSGETFSVQVGSFSDEKSAQKKAKSIPESFVDQTNAKGKTVYRVFSGRFKTKKDAINHLKKLKKQKIDGFVKQL